MAATTGNRTARWAKPGGTMNTTSPGNDDPELTELLATRSSATLDGCDGTLAPGARIGRYRIVGLLGRGGMGEVYRADQLQPVRRTVALKLLRKHRLDARNLAHFEVESQLLAQMRHPAIAQIYDADTTVDGKPFFAMEFIAGLPLTRFCAQHALSLRQRIELFIRICEGVQHAHQKGVIHRDLKPGNLLVDDVDGRALPKIIDFGIAVAATPHGGWDAAGTPVYMSPEQADQDRAGSDLALVDTRSDVYSLGVVLYELLTGERPSIAGETVTRNSRTQPLPSARLATLAPGDADRIARAQGVSAPQMSRLLRRELDWVVTRAMRHDRNDRYTSAAALADDLQRFLDGKPVQAVPASRWYMWSTFARRHRVALLAAAVALTALLGGLAVSVYGLVQARTQRAVAEQRSEELGKVVAFQQSMLQGVDIEAMGIGLADSLRQQLVNATPLERAGLERALARASTADIARGLIDRNMLVSAESVIERDFLREPALAADLHESIAHVRDSLGLHEIAASGFRRVADYRTQALGAVATATLSARARQIDAMLLAAQTKQALALVVRTLEEARTLAPGDPLLIKLQQSEAEALSAVGERKHARTLLEALYQSTVEQRGERDPVTMDVVNTLAILLSRMGESGLARDRMERLLPIREALLGAEHASTLDALSNLAVLRTQTDDNPGALELQHRLVGIRERRSGSEHPLTLAARGNLASMLISAQQFEQALHILTEVEEASARVLGADHPQAVRAKLNLATAYARVNQLDKTLALQREVIAVRNRVLGADHPDTIFIRLNYAGSLRQSGQNAASLAEAKQMLPVALEVLGDHHSQTQSGMEILADAASELGDIPLALASYQQLIDARSRTIGDGATLDAKIINAAWQMEGLLRPPGRHEEADRLRSRYVLPLLEAKRADLSPGLVLLVDDILETERQEALDAAALAAAP